HHAGGDREDDANRCKPENVAGKGSAAGRYDEVYHLLRARSPRTARCTGAAHWNNAFPHIRPFARTVPRARVTPAEPVEAVPYSPSVLSLRPFCGSMERSVPTCRSCRPLCVRAPSPATLKSDVWFPDNN